jgi:endonuclease-3 related protein
MSPSIGSGRPVLARWRRIPGPARDRVKARLLRLYVALERRYGPQRWWPGRTPYEIAVGAILVQFTGWDNAARAVRALRSRGLLAPARLAAAGHAALTAALLPAGTYRVKARRVRAFTRWLLDRFGGRFHGMRRHPLAPLRQELLGVPGIGPETADAILLYAAGRPVFVVDEYARRVLGRHRLVAPGDSYEAIRSAVEAHLPSDPALFNEFHALLVAVGKEHCGTVPRCAGCPLRFDLGGRAPFTARPRRGRPVPGRPGARPRRGRPGPGRGRPTP